MTSETLDPAQKSPSSTLKASVCALVLALWIVVMFFVLMITRLLAPTKAELCFLVFHKFAYRLFNIKLQVKGKRHTGKPTLYLGNHISYLDIVLLGSQIPGYFIAKSEVASWPVFGVLAKIQNTLFIERKSRRIKQQLAMLSAHLDQKKDNLILFPEGTSTNGEDVVPFKASLLQAVEMADIDVSIQPVTIAYTNYQGKPMSRFIRDHYAWYDTMPFGSHFFAGLGMGASECEITFHTPVKLEGFESRKACAEHCFQQVQKGLADSLAGA